MSMTYGGDQITFNDNSTQNTAAKVGMVNRIINGAMQIDQRNAGASVTVNNGNQNFSVDRWWGQGTSSAGVYTMQRSSIAPAGFTNSLLITVTTADASLAANDLYDFSQFIEGFNVSDFGFGTASAATITLSFWVRSSVTGTFGGAFGNNAGNRGYPFTYTINSANTWEQKTVTITGDTSGTWTTDNTTGLRVYFGLGAGSTFSGTAGVWGSSLFLTATGATNLMATNGATFYITGVQLEKGSTATSFDYRPYSQELALCQRYFYKTYNQSVAIASSAQYAGSGAFAFAPDATCSNCHRYFSYPVSLRASPTITGYSPNNGNTSNPIWNSGSNTNIPWNPFCANENGFGFHVSGSSVNIGTTCYLQMTASAEL